MNNQDGFLVIDKPEGITSHDVVAKARKLMGTKRIGHAGTLDPMATGVLVLGVNNATKFLQYAMEGKKRYLAVIKLGVSTTTDDKEGETIEVLPTGSISDEKLISELSNFKGAISQVPSAVSAKKVGGKRAYDLVREGAQFQLKAREILIENLNILKIDRSKSLTVKIDITCSAGTYIRAIARDLGKSLKVGGHLTELRRIAAYPYEEGDAKPLEQAKLIPLLEAVTKMMPLRTLNEDEVRDLRFGRQIRESKFSGIGAGITESGEVIAIIRNLETGAQPLTVLHP